MYPDPGTDTSYSYPDGSPTTVPTPQATVVPTKVVVTTSTPGVVQTLPVEYAVEVQVASNGNPVDPKIITTFRGGRGINFITQVEVVNTQGRWNN